MDDNVRFLKQSEARRTLLPFNTMKLKREQFKARNRRFGWAIKCDYYSHYTIAICQGRQNEFFDGSIVMRTLLVI